MPVGFLPNLTAWSYAAWMCTPLWDAADNLANPEHYFKRTIEVSPGGLQSEISKARAAASFPFLREQKEFPLQVAGPKVLKHGTTFGMLHISARDVPKPRNEKYAGVEVRATVWYPDGVEDAHIGIECQHITTEIISTALQCQKEIVSGVNASPAPPTSTYG